MPLGCTPSFIPIPTPRRSGQLARARRPQFMAQDVCMMQNGAGLDLLAPLLHAACYIEKEGKRSQP